MPGKVPGRCPGVAQEVLFGRPAAGGARIKKKWRFRAMLSDFVRSEWSNYHQFLTILTTSDFSAQARWFLMFFYGFSKTPRLCRKFVFAVPVQ